ncbi:hypothetical protein BO78DRAFT_381669 [Aspergillus sclerotiicarbonarius CBS 121057]|uniref:Uncharacterized protein n=1 Tax=Aspergillus sclerotiicarbonarius (strain CBS 121057 / IBT 28362) TaxID=1448318 RepID=A0A319EWL5_ASPSB|nr:hypothetical protein BO78DRAFT_381669 [Aspergillus sclerotiicarbonarius CBS 121057]
MPPKSLLLPTLPLCPPPPPPPFLPHLLPKTFTNQPTKTNNPNATTVPETDPTAVRNVVVLTPHPNGTARSSQRSLDPSGQIWDECRGARIGKGAGLGTQVEDWVFFVGR